MMPFFSSSSIILAFDTHLRSSSLIPRRGVKCGMPGVISITFWYNVAEITDNGEVRKLKKSEPPPTLKSLVLDGLSDTTTVDDVKRFIYLKLKVPPSHQALEQREGTRKKRRVLDDPMEEATPTSFHVLPTDRLVGDLGMTLQPSSKTKLKTSFHLRTRITVKDYSETTGKFYRKFDEDGSYHKETVLEAMSKSFTSQLIAWMWRKHFITRLALISFAIVALLSLIQTIAELGKKMGVLDKTTEVDVWGRGFGL